MNGTILDRPAVRTTMVSAQVQRVCLVTEAAGGGVGRHFLDLAEGLAARGLVVVGIYSPRRCDGFFRQRAAQIDAVKFIELPLRRAVHPGDLLDVARLASCIRRAGPFDLVHGHSSKGGALVRLAGRWLDVPAIYTPHGWITMDPQLSAVKRAIYGAAERWLACQSAAIIAVSGDEAEHARQLGIDPRRVKIVANGIAAPKFPPRDEARQRLGFTDTDLVIGSVGRLVPQKAPDVLVNAFARLAGEFPQVRLLLVGSGPLEAKLHALIAQLGLESRVRLVGEVAATELLPALDIFCLSSRYEGLPYVLLEALAAGLPIVSTRVGGAATCVTPGENGLLVAADDAPALSAALGQLAAHPEQRMRFAATSLSRSNAFTVEHMITETLSAYESVVSSRS